MFLLHVRGIKEYLLAFFVHHLIVSTHVIVIIVNNNLNFIGNINFSIKI